MTRVEYEILPTVYDISNGRSINVSIYIYIFDNSITTCGSMLDERRISIVRKGF